MTRQQADGGMELAVWCDLTVMEESAYIGCTAGGVSHFSTVGLSASRASGHARALDIILTGRDVSADECLRIGACDRLVADGESRPLAEELSPKSFMGSRPVALHTSERRRSGRPC